MNHKRLRRLGFGQCPQHCRRLRYRKRLQVRRRGGRKRALGTRAPMAISQGPNQRRSLDFVSDALVCGRRFSIFALVDDYDRECLALIADTSISGMLVARELDLAIPERLAKPAMVVCDNGTELTSMAILRWSQDRYVEWHYIVPGKRQQNGMPAPSSRGAGNMQSLSASASQGIARKDHVIFSNEADRRDQGWRSSPADLSRLWNWVNQFEAAIRCPLLRQRWIEAFPASSWRASLGFDRWEQMRDSP